MRRSFRLAVAAALLAAAAAWAQAPSEFAWRATLATPAQAALVRVALPAEALIRLHGAGLEDVRVFNGDGQAVPFALSAPQPPAAATREVTRRYPALPLYGVAPTAGRANALQVRVEDGGAQRSVWVQMKPGAADAAQPGRLPSAIFDTRGEKRTVSAVVVHAQLGANRPVPIRLSISHDLANWTPVAARGRIYRFEGDNAPRNDTLELETPLSLEGRYLRLDWQGEEGVSVQSIAGLVTPAARKKQLVTATLPPARADGPNALEWELGFATPIAQMELGTRRPNTLVPVRILGRNRVSEPWRELGRAVVWRLGLPGADHANPPTPLSPTSVRWLRVEATHDMTLEGIPLTASVGFEPVQLVFVAGGPGPFQLAAGRENSQAAALPLHMLSSTSSVKVDELPQASITEVNAAPQAAEGIRQWLPRGVEPRTALLWAVLLGGVLLLGGVAWSLLRQVNRQ